MSARLLLCSVVFGVGVVSACGGATDSGLFGGTSSGDVDSGSNVDAAGTHDSGGMNPDGSMNVDGATPQPDAETPHDASPQPDTGPPPDVVACMGTAGCKVGTDACCRTTNNGQNTYACKPLGQCDNGQGDSLEIPCDKQRDCELLGAPGDVCCVTAGGTNNGASDVSCKPAAQCTQAQNSTRMCDISMAGACMTGGTATGVCSASTVTIPGYNICH